MGIAHRALLVAVLTTTASCGAPEPTVSDEVRARSGDLNLAGANLSFANLTGATLDEGALYRFNWVFPKSRGRDGSRIGFGPAFAGRVETARDERSALRRTMSDHTLSDSGIQ